MADFQTSEVDAKPAPVNLGLSRVKFSNNGNQTIVVWQWKQYLCNSSNCTHCLTIVTIVGDVTMETKVRSLL
jgi:hypothetical protein